MPRLKNSDVEERETWVLEHFRQDPGMSVPKMNKVFKDHFKSNMRATRMYELRSIVREELGWTKAAKPKNKPVEVQVAEVVVPDPNETLYTITADDF